MITCEFQCDEIPISVFFFRVRLAASSKFYKSQIEFHSLLKEKTYANH